MKRDFDLIRKILLTVEEDTSGQGMQLPELMERVLGYEVSSMTYNIQKMIEADLIHGEVYSQQGGVALISDLTNNGHNFLDAARSETIWKQAKDQLAKVGDSTTLEVLKALLVQTAKQLLNLPP